MFSPRFIVQSYCSWLCLALGCHGSFADGNSNVARSGTNPFVIPRVTLASPASSHNGTAVPTSTALSSTNATNSSPTLAPFPTAYSTSNNTTGPGTSAPANATDLDILTIAHRRIDFIIAKQSGASSLAAWLSTLGADGKWLDSEVNYTRGCDGQRANWPAADHWIRVVALAAAWHGGFAGASPKYVKSAALRKQIGLAMDWWFERDFKVASCLDAGGKASCPCSTPGLWNTNWFPNVIGVPRLVGQACLLLSTTLTPTQLENCTHITARTFNVFQRPIRPVFLYGANVLDVASIGIALGLFTQNVSIVADASEHVHSEVQVETGFQANGILEDGSFGQHRGILYNGNYGKDYSNDVLELEIEAGGTRFASTGTSRAAFESLMDASQWMIYHNTMTSVLHWDFSTEGRFISFPVIDSQATASLKINLTELKVLATVWHSSELQRVHKDLTTKTSTANVGRLLGNRYFWNNDYMVTRGERYVSTLKMYSSRTRNTECLNSQNPFGFHLSDGTTYTYLKGDEYEDIAAVWDWNMIPGTTVDYGATPLECGTTKHVGIEDFVGGVSTGKLGMAVMRYTNPLTKVFSFQKAWFYFDNDVQHVMVSILNSTTTAPIFSILDQRKRDGPIFVDSLPVSSGNFTRPQTLFHGSTGYLFPAFPPLFPTSPSAPQLSISTGNRTGNWSALGISTQPPTTTDLFAAWLPHDAAYPSRPVAYSVFPGRTHAQFLAETCGALAGGAAPLHTLRADTLVSAVQDRVRGVAMAAFWSAEGGMVRVPPSWRAGTPGVHVAVDRALVMVLDQRTWTVTVADPTQRLVGARLTFDVRGLWPRGWGASGVKSVDVVFPVAPRAGSSISLSLVD